MRSGTICCPDQKIFPSHEFGCLRNQVDGPNRWGLCGNLAPALFWG